MSRASIPPMTSNNSNPRLHLGMDALLSKLYKISFLQEPRFRMYLLDMLIDKWFADSPRELFEITMKAEYKWRLSLHAPYAIENVAMTSSVVGYNEVDPSKPLVPTGADLVPLKGEAEPQGRVEDVADEYYHRGWNEGRDALREEVLGDEAKRAIKNILQEHRLRKSASGSSVCNCMRGVSSLEDWSAHVMLRIINYLRNEFVSQSGGGQ